MAAETKTQDVLPLSPNASRNIPRARLEDVAAGDRFQTIDRLHSYFCGTQDDHKAYDWSGYFRGYGIPAAIQPGYYVPIASRKPDATIGLAATIVGRLTAMVFGEQNRPTIQVAGDEDAEAYVRAIAKASRIFQKFVEARNLGGSCGGVVVSYGLVDKKPRVQIHNAKHCRVLRWRDRDEYVPEAVLKAYSYEDEVWVAETGKYTPKKFWYARYWDDETEYVWDRIPDEQFAADPLWYLHAKPTRGVEHNAGECPVVWIQNVPCSDDPDGACDYAGECHNLDRLNQLESSTTSGTILNTDPTLVVKTTKSPQGVKKGSGSAIFSEGGAEYLTMPGDAMRAATEEKAGLRQAILDACQVVIPSAEKLSGNAQSAAAIRLLFAPMTAQCDVLREQYGDMGIVRVLEGLLRLCKAAVARGEEVELPPRDEIETNDETGESKSVEKDQVPGDREVVTLLWPTYFPPTWTEKGEAVKAVQAANGGKPVIAQRTAVEAVGLLFGVEDADAELATIEGDADRALERQAAELQMFAENSPDPDPDNEGGGGGGGKGGPGVPGAKGAPTKGKGPKPPKGAPKPPKG